MPFSIYEAKTHLSRLIDRAAVGEEVVITRHGRPVAKLVPFAPKVKRRKLDLMRGEIRMDADFNAPLPDEVLATFEGRE